MQLSLSTGQHFEVEVHTPATTHPHTPTLMLIAGMSQQLVAWPLTFVELLTTAGFRVIRFDSRDIGLSCSYDHLGLPNLVWQGLRYMARLPVQAPYTIADMAQDSWNILDALEIKQVHLMGVSLGGMIAQEMAANQPQRVAGVTLMMTSSGAPGLPGPSMAARKVLLSKPANNSLEARIEVTKKALRVIGSPGYPTPEHELHDRVALYQTRAYRPQGGARQLLAGMAGPDRSAQLSKLTMPVTIIHGQQDCLIPLACGQDLAKKIAHANTDFIQGMGHDLPKVLYPRIVANVARAKA
jgi:pimeloyl-ACP methyl ester carboxylesterase